MDPVYDMPSFRQAATPPPNFGGGGGGGGAVPAVRDHVIVCGDPTGLPWLVRPLRHLAPEVAVVLLHPDPPDADDAALLQQEGFRGVFWVRGVARRARDLRRAGADSCRIVILRAARGSGGASAARRGGSGGSGGSDGNGGRGGGGGRGGRGVGSSASPRTGEGGLDNAAGGGGGWGDLNDASGMGGGGGGDGGGFAAAGSAASGGRSTDLLGGDSADTDTIVTACVIQTQFPACRLLVEFVDGASMGFLPLKASFSHPLHWPQYCAGNVMLSSLQDALLCQGFYNQDLLGLVRRLLHPEECASAANAGGGKGGGGSRHNGGGSSSLSSSSSSSSATAGIQENRWLVQMAIPAVFQQRTYGELFTEMVITRNLLLLGLYRSPTVHNARLPYVFTNPPSDTKLSAHDRAFVLCGRRDTLERLVERADELSGAAMAGAVVPPTRDSRHHHL